MALRGKLKGESELVTVSSENDDSDSRTEMKLSCLKRERGPAAGTP